jgi:hypothetical protein
MLIVCIASVLGAWAADAGKEENKVITPKSSQAASASKAGDKPVSKSVIKDGTWRVGKDVAAGKYQTQGAADSVIPMCYWHTALDDSGQNIIAQGVSDGADEQGLVTLKAGQYFKTSGCKAWTKL